MTRMHPIFDDDVFTSSGSKSRLTIIIIIIIVMVKLIIQCDNRDKLYYKLKLVQQFNETITKCI